MLVRSIEMLIRAGKTEGLAEKLATLYALGTLSKADYERLMKELGA